MRLRIFLPLAPAIALAAIALFTATGSRVFSATSAKSPIPDAAALKTAAALVDDVYKDDLANAKTPDAKLALAQKMLNAAADEKDPATHYALLSKTLSLACYAGDLQSAFVVIDSLDSLYNIDALKLKADSIAYIGKNLTIPDQRKKFIALSTPLVDTALAADRYDIAKSTAAAIVDAAGATNDAPLLSEANAHQQQVLNTEQAYTDANKAQLLLATNPNDPDANLKVGSFRCLIKGDWAHGLPLLALSSDDSLKSLAKTELVGVTATEDQVKLADAWYDLAEKNTGPAKTNLQAHATQWYQAALPNLTGLAKMKVEKRLPLHAPMQPAIAPATTANPAPQSNSLLDQLVPSAACVTKKTAEGLEISVKPRALDCEIISEQKFTSPIVITAVAKTDSTNIRLFFGDKGRVIFNWEMNEHELRCDDPLTGATSALPGKGGVPKNTWVTIRWILDEKQSRIQVDGVDVANFPGDYSGITGTVGIGTHKGATVTVKSLEVSTATPPLPPNVNTINLLGLVDTNRDSVEGKWQLKNGELVSSMPDHCTLLFPYYPPVEYDFHMDFSRAQGNSQIVAILTAGGRLFTWSMGGWENTVFGFERISGVRADKNKTSAHSRIAIENGKQYNVTIKVRKTGLEAYINGKLVSQWKTDYSDMTLNPEWNVGNKITLGVGTHNSVATFSKIEVTEISGSGSSKASGQPLVASTTPPSLPGLHAPASPLTPYTTPLTPAPAYPTQNPAPLSTPTQPPAPPSDPNAIERPAYANRPKTVLKNITSITAMMVRVSDDGDTLGLTSDILASVAPDSRHSRDGGAGFIRSRVGEEMRTSFEEAVRAVKLRYPTWDGGRIDFSFGEKYTEHDGGSAGTAFGVLLLSSLEDINLDPQCAITGDITVDWKVRQVGGVASKIHGAILDKCLYAAIPTTNESVMNDLPLLYGENSLWNIQVLSIPTLQQAVATVRQDRTPQLAEALSLFATLQPALDKSGRIALHDPATIATLKHILELAPNHLSAKALLAIADNTAPKTLSSTASLYRLSIIAYPYRSFIDGRGAITRTSLLASVTANARKQIEQLRHIASKDIQPLVTDLAGLIEVAEETAAASRPNPANFNKSRDTLLGHLATISSNRDLLEKLVREAY